MLAIKNLSVRYGGIQAVSGVDLQVNAGEVVILLGANGAGKSSIINSVMGLVKPNYGEIKFESTLIHTLPPEARGKLGIAFSPEGRKLFTGMSIEENIYCAMRSLSASQKRKRYTELAQMFPLLQEKRIMTAGLLSGGQQQMVAVARALANRPKLLVLDEPFLGLAPIWISQISDAIQAALAEGTTILMAEQMARPALKIADRGYVIRSGEIVSSASAKDFGEEALAEHYL